MRRTLRNWLASTLGAAAVAGLALAPATAAEKKDFKVAWSIYVGWMPWGYAADSGIVKKWADKYGITIEVKQINDYVESINQYTAGAFDAVTLTNMDALSIPAAGGVDTTAVIVGDYLERQRRHHPQGQGQARGHQGPERSTWSSSRSRTTCSRARSKASSSPRRT